MLKTLRKILPVKLKRSNREKLEFCKITVEINCKPFDLYDFSETGVSMVPNATYQLKVNQTYPADFLIFNKKKLEARIKVVRIDNTKIGCQVVDLPEYKKFLELYLKEFTEK